MTEDDALVLLGSGLLVIAGAYILWSTAGYQNALIFMFAGGCAGIGAGFWLEFVVRKVAEVGLARQTAQRFRRPHQRLDRSA